MAVAELQRANPETGAQHIANKETVHASSGETVVYQQGKSRIRQILGNGMVYIGAGIAVYEVIKWNIPAALTAAAVSIAGLWVRPKEGK
jgi:hypothetical protein